MNTRARELTMSVLMAIHRDHELADIVEIVEKALRSAEARGRDQCNKRQTIEWFVDSLMRLYKGRKFISITDIQDYARIYTISLDCVLSEQERSDLWSGKPILKNLTEKEKTALSESHQESMKILHEAGLYGYPNANLPKTTDEIEKRIKRNMQESKK